MTSINASDTIYYDKSIITQFDAAGTTAMLNIEFETGSAKLSESSREYIIQVYEVMRNNPGIKIAIHGHTDDVGAEEDNLILSKERAKSVRDALISLGIEQNRLFTKGFGESQPLVPNDSDKNRKLNRRTEFVVLENE
jgi:outer membrane protein OmpA-like peptidoglycan-associated protein